MHETPTHLKTTIFIKIKRVSVSKDFVLTKSFFEDYFENIEGDIKFKPIDYEINIELDVLDNFEDILLALYKMKKDLLLIIFFVCPFVKIEIMTNPYVAECSNDCFGSLNCELNKQTFSDIKKSLCFDATNNLSREIINTQTIFHKKLSLFTHLKQIKNCLIKKSEKLPRSKAYILQDLEENILLHHDSTEIFDKYKTLFAIFELLQEFFGLNSKLGTKSIAGKIENLDYESWNLKVFYKNTTLINNLRNYKNYSKELEDSILNKASRKKIWTNIIECLSIVRHKIIHGETNKITKETLYTSYKILYKVIVELFFKNSSTNQPLKH